jgi:hypothetical protein
MVSALAMTSERTTRALLKPTGRRLISFLLAAAVIGIPAGVLRVLCVGGSCERNSSQSVTTPFCSLPQLVRHLIQNGYYERRSPDVIVVAGATPIVGGTSFKGAAEQPPWPSAETPPNTEVPILFWGEGVRKHARVPPETGLEDIAPTLASMIGLRRPHPEVRSGRALRETAVRSRPRLVVQVIWKGVDSGDIRAAMSKLPALTRFMKEGSGTLRGTVPSFPLDPAAAIATIGTGGLPSEHGITGTLIRNDRGRLTASWGPRSPVNVIATLGDHLDEKRRQRPVVGVVGTDVSDRGAIGGRWYWPRDRDHISVTDDSPSEIVDEVWRMLHAKRFGQDRVTDLLAVAVEGRLGELDRQLAALVARANRVSRGSLIVSFTATGSFASWSADPWPAERVEGVVEAAIPSTRPVIEASSPGGLFLDQDALSDLGISDDAVVNALLNSASGGEPPVVDAFPGRAVTFARFC